MPAATTKQPQRYTHGQQIFRTLAPSPITSRVHVLNLQREPYDDELVQHWCLDLLHAHCVYWQDISTHCRACWELCKQLDTPAVLSFKHILSTPIHARSSNFGIRQKQPDDVKLCWGKHVLHQKEAEQLEEAGNNTLGHLAPADN